MMGHPSFFLVTYMELSGGNCVKNRGFGYFLPIFCLWVQKNYLSLHMGRIVGSAEVRPMNVSRSLRQEWCTW